MATIPLSNGRVALVDECDFELVSKFRWGIHGYGRWTYAKTLNGHPKGVLMHRMILGLLDSPALFVDHKNGDGLDNRRANIRVCTTAENMMNRRKHKPGNCTYKGVAIRRKSGTWQARIRINNKLIHLGAYPTEEAAALAYNEAAKRYFGQFANLNEVDGSPTPRLERQGYNEKRRQTDLRKKQEEVTNACSFSQ